MITTFHGNISLLNDYIAGFWLWSVSWFGAKCSRTVRLILCSSKNIFVKLYCRLIFIFTAGTSPSLLCCLYQLCNEGKISMDAEAWKTWSRGNWCTNLLRRNRKLYMHHLICWCLFEIIMHSLFFSKSNCATPKKEH